MSNKYYYIYILASASGTLCTSLTNNLIKTINPYWNDLSIEMFDF